VAFTKEIVDFAGLSDSEIKSKLTELNIPLTPDEALKIQNDMLGRAPSIAELVYFPSKARNIAVIKVVEII
jgi:phosphoribosylformylglycinamidine (FGAM) synthase-like enzyme